MKKIIVSLFCTLLLWTNYSLAAHIFTAEEVRLITDDANTGNPKAQHLLGRLYSNGQIKGEFQGEGIFQNLTEAKNWFEKAAIQGSSKSQTELGTMYLRGLGVKQNHKKGEDWLRKAALQGDELALLSLGNMYYFGKGVDKDYALAKSFYEEAINKSNSSDGLFFLAVMYTTGKGVPKDLKKAKELAARSCVGGSQLGCNAFEKLN
ncbi:MAG TPA: tetratricopeptide repeat protein [Oscillospiraceae bacterium]|nr:tetratricopeptide repeat protein [Oscillospiraceae bacterium]